MTHYVSKRWETVAYEMLKLKNWTVFRKKIGNFQIEWQQYVSKMLRSILQRITLKEGTFSLPCDKYFHIKFKLNKNNKSYFQISFGLFLIYVNYVKTIILSKE